MVRRHADDPEHLARPVRRTICRVNVDAAQAGQPLRGLKALPELYCIELRLVPVGHVRLHGQVGVHLTRIVPDVLDVQSDPVRFAALPVIDELEVLDWPPIPEQFTQARQVLQGRVRPVQQFLRVLAHALLQFPARDARVGGVDPFDPAVGASDHHHVGAGVHDLFQYIEPQGQVIDLEQVVPHPFLSVFQDLRQSATHPELFGRWPEDGPPAIEFDQLAFALQQGDVPGNRLPSCHDQLAELDVAGDAQ